MRLGLLGLLSFRGFCTNYFLMYDGSLIEGIEGSKDAQNDWRCGFVGVLLYFLLAIPCYPLQVPFFYIKIPWLYFFSCY